MLLFSRPHRSPSSAASAASRRRVVLAAGLLSAMLLPGVEARAQAWAEVGDAGSVVPQTPAFDPKDIELATITGCLRYHAGNDRDVDLFRVNVQNFEEFRFTVVASAANLDPKIYLFYADGRGIAARDDGVPGNSKSLQPSLPVDCFIDENDIEVCGTEGYGDLSPGDYLVGITRHDLVPYAPNPNTGDGAMCPGGSTPNGGNCPIFPSTSLPPQPNDPDDPRDDWVFSRIQNPYETRLDPDDETIIIEQGMESQSVTIWWPEAPRGDIDGLILAGEYTAALDSVEYASEDDTGLSGRTDCTLPEPSSSAAVGCGAVLLLRAWRGRRWRERAKMARGSAS